MHLDALYRHLYRIAAMSHKPQSAPLTGGARMAVAVRPGFAAVTFSRPGAELSTTELLTFHRKCGVPAGAKRTPIEGQRIIERDGIRWFSVSYDWQVMQEASAA